VRVHKLLLLGAGESGKSTLFKQLVSIYGKGYPEAERTGFIPSIHNNVIISMIALCNYSRNFGPVLPQNEAIRDSIEELKGGEELTQSMAEKVTTLWNDPGIQATYSNRSRFQLPDSAKYFFDQVNNLWLNDYIPTNQDILRVRVRTTGIIETEFEIDGNKFRMFDVGGQRNERKKWIHCFENVRALLFVAALNEYDQVLFEDENINRMTEALTLFDEVCNLTWFQHTSILLFLNKRDLFQEKLLSVPLKGRFPEYLGDNSYESACQFVRSEFESKNKNPKKSIYTHITCATDTTNVMAVFNGVKDTIIRNCLDQAGLL